MSMSKVLVAAGLIAGVMLAPSYVGARDLSAPREVTVYYDGLDSTSASGASVLYTRLRGASRSVCAPLDGRELRQRAAYQACYQQALSDAVVKVNRTAVTALHTRAVKSVKAS